MKSNRLQRDSAPTVGQGATLTKNADHNDGDVGASDHAALIALLVESYETSYRGSSLKVRQRYRKLIVALGKLEGGCAPVIPSNDEELVPARAEVAQR